MRDYYNDRFKRKKLDDSIETYRLTFKGDRDGLRQHILNMMLLTSSFEDVAKILANVMIRLHEGQQTVHTTYRNALDIVVLEVQRRPKLDKAGVVSLLRWVGAATHEALNRDEPF